MEENGKNWLENSGKNCKELTGKNWKKLSKSYWKNLEKLGKKLLENYGKICYNLEVRQLEIISIFCYILEVQNTNARSAGKNCKIHCYGIEIGTYVLVKFYRKKIPKIVWQTNVRYW